MSGLVGLEPPLDGLLGVVVALHDLATAGVADPRLRRRHVDVVHALAVDAHPASGDPVEHDLERHLEAHHDVEGPAVEDHLELLGLRLRARETVEHEPLTERAVGRDRLLHDPDDDVVGNQLTGIHELLRLEPERRAEARELAEEIAGGKVRDVVVLGNAHGLRALSGTLLSEKDEPGSWLHRLKSSGNPRSCASSAGCRSVSSFRERHRP